MVSKKDARVDHTQHATPEAERLLAAITSGEWEFVPFKRHGINYDVRGSVESWRETPRYGRTSTRVADYVFQDNGEFIAAAPRLMRALTAERDALRQAAFDLYLAGRWDCASVPPETAAQLWEALRDALGLPVGTATAAGVASARTEPPV